MIVTRINPMSAAKLMGVLYALVGILFGGLISLLSIVGGALGAATGESQVAGMLFGAGAIIFLPIFYGVLGFVMTLIGAALYNGVASMVGGLELEVRNTSLS